jgi:hypothetical protein
MPHVDNAQSGVLVEIASIIPTKLADLLEDP